MGSLAQVDITVTGGSVSANSSLTTSAITLDPRIATAFKLKGVNGGTPAAADIIEVWASLIAGTDVDYPLIDEGVQELGSLDTFAAASGDGHLSFTLPAGYTGVKFIFDGSARTTTQAITVSGSGSLTDDSGA